MSKLDMKPIPGYKDYFATKDGHIFSTKKYKDPRQLKPGRHRYGYKMVALNSKSFCVHKLIMMTFVGPMPKGFHTAHLNGDPSDNRLENLIYCSPKENQRHSKLHGTKIMGQTVGTSKLTDKEILEIRAKFVRSGPRESNAMELAKEYKIHWSTVNFIVRRKTWRHL